MRQFVARSFRRLAGQPSATRKGSRKGSLRSTRLVCESLEDRRLLSSSSSVDLQAVALASSDHGSGVSLAPASCQLPAEAASVVQGKPLVGASVRGVWTSKTIMTETFEGTFPGTGWTLAGDPTFATTTYRKHAGMKSAYCVGSSCSPSVGYPNYTNSWMVYGPFDLSDADRAAMSFWTTFKTELNYDWLCWGASLDGESFFGEGVSGITTTWLKGTFDLTNVYSLGNVCGQSQVWVGFWFRSDDINTNVGAFVDDVTLTKNVPPVDLKPVDVYAADPSDITKPIRSIGPDQPVELVCKYTYTGPAKSVDQTVRLQLDSAPAVDIDVTLAGPGTYYCHTPWTATAGSHSLTATLDVNGRVTEANETNNIRIETTAFRVTATGGGQITGTVWDDLDNDNVLDMGEPGLRGFTLFLDQDADGQFEEGERTAVTNANGKYTFYGLAAGKYYVGEIPSEGWQQTYPTVAAESLQAVAIVEPGQVSTPTTVASTVSTVQAGPATHTSKFAQIDVQESAARLLLAGAYGDFPSSFDLRSDGGRNYVTPVKDQGPCGSCWAHAAMATLESSILKDGGPVTNLSENNLKNYHGFDWGPCDGGNSYISEAYFSRGSGPKSEADDPYYPGDDRETPPPSIPNQYYVKNMLRFNTPDEIKSALMSDGALDTYYYMNNSYFNEATSTYYYSGSASANHEVTMVGWDDNRVCPGAPGNGAWLIKNSWGTGWGDGGYFWLSYYDTYGKEAESYRDAVAPDTYEKIYYYDYFGDVVDYSCPYGMNAFTPTENTDLRAVGFFTEADGAGYTVTVYDTLSGGVLSNVLATQSGTAEFAGYHTIDLASTVALAANDSVYVSLHITNGGTYCMAADQRYAGYNSDSTAAPGQSYYSTNGITWTDLATLNSTANFCIKMLTGRASAVPGEQTATIKSGGKATGVNFGNRSLYAGLYDFGNGWSKVEGGYSRVTHNTALTATTAFGWVPGSGTVKSADRGNGSSLERDVNYTTGATFAANVANGTYKVSILLGDRQFARDNVCVSVEGMEEAGITTAKGELVWKTYTVEVADGQLTVRLWDAGGGTDAHAAIAAMKVLPVAETLGPEVSQSAAFDGATLEHMAAATLSAPRPQADGEVRSVAATAIGPQAPSAQPSAARLDVAPAAFPSDTVFKRLADSRDSGGSTIAANPQPALPLQPFLLAWKDLADQAFAIC